MLVHTVFFWLRPDLSDADRASFLKGLNSLKRIVHISGLYIGTPAATDRPVVDNTYSYGLTVLLDSMAQHDAYQEDPIHKEFVRQHADKWERIVVYDAD